jgi:hypothetical protein
VTTKTLHGSISFAKLQHAAGATKERFKAEKESKIGQ